MALQIMIIGLGQFGMSLARAFAEKGVEVLAVDSKKDLVDEIAPFVAEAVCANASDESELAQLHPAKRDVAICAIGSESSESSIMCTALLRQMGVPLIAARAHSAMHSRILKMVGAHIVVDPEMEFGRRFANRILYRNVIADTPLSDEMQLTEILVRPDMVGKTLIQLELPKRFGIIVAAIRRGEPPVLIRPDPLDPLQAQDHLLLVCSETAISRFAGEDRE